MATLNQNTGVFICNDIVYIPFPKGAHGDQGHNMIITVQEAYNSIKGLDANKCIIQDDGVSMSFGFVSNNIVLVTARLGNRSQSFYTTYDGDSYEGLEDITPKLKQVLLEHPDAPLESF